MNRWILFSQIQFFFFLMIFFALSCTVKNQKVSDTKQLIGSENRFPIVHDGFYQAQELWFNGASKSDLLYILPDYQNQFVIKSKSKEVIEKTLKDLDQFSSSLDPKFHLNQDQNKRIEDHYEAGFYEASAENHLTQRVKDTLWNGLIDTFGYNCYGAAAYASELSEERGISESRYENILASSFCQELKVGMAPQAGDIFTITAVESIGGISTAPHEPWHTGIFVSEQLVYAKDSSEGPTMIQDLNSHFGYFLSGAEKDCISNTETWNQEKIEKCNQNFLRFYRCGSLVTEKEKILRSIPSELVETIQAIDYLYDLELHKRNEEETVSDLWSPAPLVDGEIDLDSYQVIYLLERGLSELDIKKIVSTPNFGSQPEQPNPPIAKLKENLLKKFSDLEFYNQRVKSLVDYINPKFAKLSQMNEIEKKKFYIVYLSILKANEHHLPPQVLSGFRNLGKEERQAFTKKVFLD